MPRRRAVMVLNSFVFGGVEEHTVQLSSRLADCGYDATVIYKDVPELALLSKRLDERRVPRLSHDTIGLTFAAQLKSAWRLAAILREMKTDVLHVQLISYYGGRVPLLAGMIARIPTVVTHHIAPDRPIGKIPHLLRLPFIARVRGFIAVSEENRRLQVRNCGLPPAKTVCVPNGVPVGDEDYDRQSAHKDLRALIGAPPEAALVGAFGRLAEQKGLEYLIAAAPDILKRAPNAYFVFVGDGELLEELRGRAVDLGVDHRTVWLGFRSDVRRLLPGIDVLAMPSRYEGLPMVLLEAMAVETPVVAHAVGGVPQAVIHGETGFLTETGAVGDFAKYIAELLTDPRLAATIGRQARAKILSDFTAQAMAERTAEVYHRALSRKASR